MEFVTILLSALMGILSPAGVVLDSVAEDAIRDRLDSAETLQVRIDNAPSYQLLQGRVERVRIAGRGVFPQPGIRIAAVDVETDAIAVDVNELQDGRAALEKPLQAGVRLVISRDDINQALQSPELAEKLRDLSLNILGGSQSGRLDRYDLVNPQVEFLSDNRLRLQATLQGQDADRLQIFVESGLGVVSGERLQLIDPVVKVNDQVFPDQIVRQLADGIGRRFDLQRLDDEGVTVRVLKLEVEPDQLAIAAFVRIDPAQPSSGN